MTPEPKRLSAREIIADRCTVALNAAYRYRDGFNKPLQNYQEGKAAAYNDAHQIMTAELKRLRNLLQNGSLTQADFGDDLPY